MNEQPKWWSSSHLGVLECDRIYCAWIGRNKEEIALRLVELENTLSEMCEDIGKVIGRPEDAMKENW